MMSIFGSIQSTLAKKEPQTGEDSTLHTRRAFRTSLPHEFSCGIEPQCGIFGISSALYFTLGYSNVGFGPS
jgi:hypothetical protein